jgi:tryptophanase
VKFLLDNNLPKSLAKGLHELSTIEGDVEVAHLQDYFAANTPDEVWMTTLSVTEPEICVISQDRRMLKIPQCREALTTTGMRFVLLAPGYAHDAYWIKAGRVVRAWRGVIEEMRADRGGGVRLLTQHGKLEPYDR